MYISLSVSFSYAHWITGTVLIQLCLLDYGNVSLLILVLSLVLI